VLAALCAGRRPDEVASEIGVSGAAALKTYAVEAVDAMLAPIRRRRANIGDDEVRRVLKRGIETATAIAEHTLTEVNAAMGMLTTEHEPARR
jgi:tryptophanyl-tRNA synthetase